MGLRGDEGRDRELCMAAVAQNPFALEYVGSALAGDFEVVMAAVQADGDALEFAADALLDSRPIVLAALATSGAIQR